MAGTGYAVAPGEYLEEWLDERGLSRQCAAELLGCSPEQFNGIAGGRTPVTAETAARLGRVTGIPAGSWLRFEAAYCADLKRQGHWVQSLPGTGRAHRYRQCTCGLLVRNSGQRPLLHNGRKHR